jgi:hypothetical protein
MSKRSIFVVCLMFVVAVTSTALADKPASHPKQYILHVRYLEGRPYHYDGSPEHVAKAINDARLKHELRILSEPEILFTENRRAHIAEGGEIDAGVEPVGYGTTIDASMRSNRDGTYELDFVAGYSWPATHRPSDFGDRVTRISGEKVCGKVRMLPGLAYRVFGEKHGNEETWWEFQIELPK